MAKRRLVMVGVAGSAISVLVLFYYYRGNRPGGVGEGDEYMRVTARVQAVLALENYASLQKEFYSESVSKAFAPDDPVRYAATPQELASLPDASPRHGGGIDSAVEILVRRSPDNYGYTFLMVPGNSEEFGFYAVPPSDEHWPLFYTNHTGGIWSRSPTETVPGPVVPPDLGANWSQVQ